jgi:hypothetical protein
VADVRGKEGKATVSGWLVIESGGQAVICDQLKANANECAGPTMVVDWTTGNSKPTIRRRSPSHSSAARRASVSAH